MSPRTRRALLIGLAELLILSAAILLWAATRPFAAGPSTATTMGAGFTSDGLAPSSAGSWSPAIAYPTDPSTGALLTVALTPTPTPWPTPWARPTPSDPPPTPYVVSPTPTATLPPCSGDLYADQPCRWQPRPAPELGR